MYYEQKAGKWQFIEELKEMYNGMRVQKESA